MSNGGEIRRILSEIFHRDIFDNRPAIPAKAIAVGADVNYWSLCKFGQPDPETDEPKLSTFVRLYRSSDGALFDTLRTLISLCDPALALSVTPATKADGDIRDEIVDMTIAAGRTAESLDAAFADGRVDREEANGILETLDGLQGVLDRIKTECLIGPAVIPTAAGIHVTRIRKVG